MSHRQSLMEHGKLSTVTSGSVRGSGRMAAAARDDDGPPQTVRSPSRNTGRPRRAKNLSGVDCPSWLLKPWLDLLPIQGAAAQDPGAHKSSPTNGQCEVAHVQGQRTDVSEQSDARIRPPHTTVAQKTPLLEPARAGVAAWLWLRYPIIRSVMASSTPSGLPQDGHAPAVGKVRANPEGITDTPPSD